MVFVKLFTWLNNFINFEDKSVLANIPNFKKLIEYVENNRKKGKCYIFLDEIQELDGWQYACKTLRLYDNSLFITGSNSKLLSREFTKEFSGRYVSFRVRPFVYKEILEYAKELKQEYSISDYLIWGGFPKIFEFNNENDLKQYLNDLNDTIIFNDLINRFKVSNIELFKRIVNFVLKSNSRIVSSRSIEGHLKSEHINGSINTIIKYLGYLEEAYIIERIKPYSSKTKTELAYYFKFYDTAVSLNSIRCMENKYDLTHNLENIVYNELLYMGYNVNVFNNNDTEIDFLAIKGNNKYYIQVAYSIVEESTYERQFRAFENIDNLSKKIIITNDDIDYSTSIVKHIKLNDFLLLED